MLAPMRGVFAVGESRGPRWELALDLLRQGEPFSLGPVTFRRADATTVEAGVASSWQYRWLTEERARKDLEEARGWVEELLASDDEFRRAVGDSSIDYVLIDDDETGSTALCRLTGNDLAWLIPPP